MVEKSGYDLKTPLGRERFGLEFALPDIYGPQALPNTLQRLYQDADKLTVPSKGTKHGQLVYPTHIDAKMPAGYPIEKAHFFFVNPDPTHSETWYADASFVETVAGSRIETSMIWRNPEDFKKHYRKQKNVPSLFFLINNKKDITPHRLLAFYPQYNRVDLHDFHADTDDDPTNLKGHTTPIPYDQLSDESFWRWLVDQQQGSQHGSEYIPIMGVNREENGLVTITYGFPELDVRQVTVPEQVGTPLSPNSLPDNHRLSKKNIRKQLPH